jgi:membrane associated rhomboid family serine protease
LTGVVAMPFLHQDLAHIISNTPPLVVLLALLAGSRGNSKMIVFALISLGGILLWLFGRGNSLHIGASGLVFALVSFLIAAGVFERRMTSLVVSILVGFFYGTTLLMGILPNQQGVSWDGHLLGGIAGVVVAWFMLKRG